MTGLAANQYICPDGYGVERFLDEAARLGYRTVGLNRDALAELPPAALRRALEIRGMRVSSLNSAGRFTSVDPAHRRQQDEVNSYLVEAAAELDAMTLCVMVGGASEQPNIAEARRIVADGLAALDERASAAGVGLGLEPVHPTGALAKGCVNSISQARALIAPLRATGLLLDVYHSWWDPDLACVFGDASVPIRLVQICNIHLGEEAAQRRNPKLDDGVLDLRSLLKALRRLGYDGTFEFEIFASDHGFGDPCPLLCDALAWYESSIRGCPAAQP